MMNLEIFYLIGVVGAFAFLLAARFTHLIISIERNRITSFICRKVIYPYVYRRMRLLQPITRLKACLVAILLAVTTLSNVFGVGSLPQLARRAGRMSTLNLVPLLASGRSALLGQLFNLALSDILGLHIVTAMTFSLQCGLHILFELKVHGFHFRDNVQFLGYMSAIGMCGTCLMVVFKKHFYEIFRCFHTVLAVLSAVAINLHIGHRSYGMYCVSFALCILTALNLFQKLRTVVTNLFLVHQRREMEVSRQGRSLILRVRGKSLKPVRPLEWYYLWIPRVSLTAPFQLHPFMVIWTDEDAVYFLVEPQAGMTYKLGRFADRQYPLYTWLDGPYGHTPAFENFPNVMFVASDFGIASHILAMRSLVIGYKEHTVLTRNITLYWEVQSEDNQNWVREWINEILNKDNGSFRLTILIFMATSEPRSSESVGTHDSIQKFYNSGDLRSRLESDLGETSGNTMLCVCAKKPLEDFTRQISTAYYPLIPHLEFVRSDHRL